MLLRLMALSTGRLSSSRFGLLSLLLLCSARRWRCRSVSPGTLPLALVTVLRSIHIAIRSGCIRLLVYAGSGCSPLEGYVLVLIVQHL